MELRSALYLDFDNFLGGLIKVDPEAALTVVQRPSVWVQRLTRAHADGATRRWLQLRCYLNPAGWVPDPVVDGGRIYLSKFRPFFTQAGFHVIDCPGLTRTGKNAADIRIVVDVMATLQHRSPLDEIVIASSDSDFTPLLHVIRAGDRRVTLISTSETAVAYEALADRYLSEQDVLDLMNPALLDGDSGEVRSEEMAQPPTLPAASRDGRSSHDGSLELRFAALVREAYAAASEPLNLAQLAADVHGRIGGEAKSSNYFGHGSFLRALHALELPDARFSPHYVWDAGRHVAPDQVNPSTTTLPRSISQFCEVASLPRIDSDLWPHAYRLLLEYLTEHDFVLTDATKLSRDKATEEGLPIARQVFTQIVRSCQFQGLTLSGDRVPTGDEVATAMVANTLSLAELAGLDCSDDDREQLRIWLHAPLPGRTIS